MENSEKGLPPKEEAPGKGGRTKMIAIGVIVMLLVVAVVGALVLTGNQGSATAAATADRHVAFTGEFINFNASLSKATGPIKNYHWNFGDGTALNNATPLAAHAYSIPGKYLILLTVSDDKGNTNSNWGSMIGVQVTIPSSSLGDNATMAQALFISNATSIRAPASISFDGASSGAWSVEQDPDGYWIPYMNETFIADMRWNFGDATPEVNGTYAAMANRTHSYATHGTLFVVMLTVKSVHAEAPLGLYVVTVASFPQGYSPHGVVKYPDTFVVATVGDPSYLDPALDYESAGGEVIQSVYETLIWYDGNKTDVFVPRLATEVPTRANGGISEDGLNYTFKIRPGVRFQDGNVMTPYDVAFSMKRVLVINYASGPAWILGQSLIKDYMTEYAWGAGAVPEELIDAAIQYSNESMTVTFHLDHQYPAFISCLAYTVGSVVEAKWVGDHTPGGDRFMTQNTYLNRHCMGTGPFFFVQWAAKQYIRLDKFNDYWGTKALVKHVLIEQINSLGTREMMLMAGDADVAYIDRQNTNDVRGNADLRIVEGNPTFNVDFIGLPQTITESSFDIGDIPLDFFADLHVRKAFVAAFDYNKYLQNVLLNTAIQPNGAIPMGMFGYNDSIPLRTYDLAIVESELKLAMDLRPGHTGSYWDNGFTIYLYYNSGNNVRRDGSMLLKNALEALNSRIHVIVEEMEGSAFIAANDAGELPLMYVGWAPDYADPDDYVLPFLYSSGTYGGPAGINNATLDALIMQASGTVDLAEREKLYYDIGMSAYENAYFLFTTQATNFHVERSWVSGYVFNSMYSGLMFETMKKG